LRFLQTLQVLELSLLGYLLAFLFDALALFAGAVFFLPDPLLVLLQERMPGFLHVEVAAAHFG
jgi:hypothetical protein